MQNEKIIIVDFGSQYTQLIARKVRAQQIYCEIVPCQNKLEINAHVKGLILSGSPFSVWDSVLPELQILQYANQFPILGIGFGAQLLIKEAGGNIAKADKRIHSMEQLKVSGTSLLFKDIGASDGEWLNESDHVEQLPEQAEVLASTTDGAIAAFEFKQTNFPVLGLQFHPEVHQSKTGEEILKNFLFHICGVQQDWTPANYIAETINSLKEQIGDQKVVMALSGGVDSTVAATLIHKAIGKNLFCIFVDHGLMRKDEAKEVLQGYERLGLNTKGVNAAQLFYKELNGISDPEGKRKKIGKLFIDIFEQEAQALTDVRFLGQGTIYPDVIESVSIGGEVKVKSHHNVGGLPEKLNLKLVEPLRYLFKDEVRKIGKELGIEDVFLQRHPFPGPGLGIRVLGAITEEKVKILQEADAIYIRHLKEQNLYNQIWQAGAILLPVQSVGVSGNERTYEYAIALRAVNSVDGMTADFVHIDQTILGNIANDIIQNVVGVNRVVYDISSKPPATIEWE